MLRPQGVLFIVVPDRRFTSDHHRPLTPFAHLLEDCEADRQESDLTHLPEILALHDLGRDPAAGTAEQFRERSSHNHENRCLHHHVFDRDTLASCLAWAGFTVGHTEQVPPIHVVGLAHATA